MKKNVTMGVLAALAMSGVFGGVSFAADKAADAKPAVTTEAKAAPAADKKVARKKAKKATRKSRKAAAKAEAAPEAGK